MTSNSASCCRYVLASACDALYVALQGTKSGTDLLTDLNFWFNPVWEDADEQLLVSIAMFSNCECVAAAGDVNHVLEACPNTSNIHRMPLVVRPPWLLGAIPASPSRGAACMGAAAWPASHFLRALTGRWVSPQIACSEDACA